MNTYLKIIAEAPGKVSLKKVPYDLIIDDDHDVIIKNRYSHISTGTELACLAGLEDWFNMPATPGYTSIGQVIEKGSAVSHVALNDLVYTFGPHASYFKINTADRWHGVCVKLPESINPEQAAFAHMGGIAITAIRKSKIELGDWVAVTGLGTIGNLAAQLAMLQGANVIAMDINQHRVTIARACGLQHVYNSSAQSMKEIITTASGGKGISTFIDATGIPAVIEDAATCINLYGELILLGSPRAEYQANLTNFLQHVHLWSHGSIEVKGALEFTLPTQPTEFSKHSIQRNSEIILQLIEANRLQINPILSHILPVNEFLTAYHGLQKDPDEYTGVIFDWEV